MFDASVAAALDAALRLMTMAAFAPAGLACGSLTGVT
jgi:hypothetical protein